MRSLLLIILLFISEAIYSQTYYPTLGVGVEWRVDYFGGIGAGSYSVNVMGDTSIAGLTYTKVIGEASTPIFYREDTAGQKIYKLRSAGVEDLIFDYALGLHDSLSINWFSSFTFTYYPDEFFVDSVSQTTIVAGSRKFMRLHDRNTNVLYWLESVGNLYVTGPLWYNSDAFIDGDYDSVMCQQQNGTQTFQLTPWVSCGSTGVNDIQGLGAISLYPDPALATLRIRTSRDQDENYQVRIYNATGILMSETVISETEAEIDLRSFAPGLYICYLQDSRGATAVKKFIKE